MFYATFRFGVFLTLFIILICPIGFLAFHLYSVTILTDSIAFRPFDFVPFLTIAVMMAYVIYFLIMLLVRARKNIEWFHTARTTSVYAIYTRCLIALFLLYLFVFGCINFIMAFMPSGVLWTELMRLKERQETHEALQTLDWSSVVIPYISVNMFFCGILLLLVHVSCPGIVTGNIFVPRKGDTAFSPQSKNP